MSEDNPPPKEICDKALVHLAEHADEFDHIVVGSDYHGITFGAVISAALGKPLLIVRPKPFDETLSLIIPIGKVDPTKRGLYVDDFFAYGSTLNHVFTYMCQSAIPNIVGTYEGVTGEFHRGHFTHDDGIVRFVADKDGEVVWPLI